MFINIRQPREYELFGEDKHLSCSYHFGLRPFLARSPATFIICSYVSSFSSTSPNCLIRLQVEFSKSSIFRILSNKFVEIVACEGSSNEYAH